MKDAQYLSRVTAGAKYHQEGADRQKGDGTGIRGRRQQEVRGRDYLGQRRQCQQVRGSSVIRPILLGSV